MTHYCIIGGGRLARHFSHYFRLRGIPHSQWQRKTADNSCADKALLKQVIADASHILLLISDQSITGFVDENDFLADKILIHCSGAHSYPSIAGVHPLMTFGEELYDLATYESIPMVCEGSARADFQFDQLFPQLNNPIHTIPAEQKALYHAYCVCAGNFSQLLWQLSAEGMQARLGLPAKVLEPYLQKNLENFFSQGSAALTGPLARGDQQTINANLDALGNQPLAAIYQQFIKTFLPVADLSTSGGLKQ